MWIERGPIIIITDLSNGQHNLLQLFPQQFWSPINIFFDGVCAAALLLLLLYWATVDASGDSTRCTKNWHSEKHFGRRGIYVLFLPSKTVFLEILVCRIRAESQPSPNQSYVVFMPIVYYVVYWLTYSCLTFNAIITTINCVGQLKNNMPQLEVVWVYQMLILILIMM